MVAYFFYMYKSKENSLTNRNILIFFSLILLVGLIKLPYLAFSFLIFAVPKKNFNNTTKIIIFSTLGIFILGGIGLLWSKYAMISNWHSYRAVHYLSQNVNSTMQMNFFLSNDSNFLLFISSALEKIFTVSSTFLMYPPSDNLGYTTASYSISLLILASMSIVYFIYPIDEKVERSSKIVSLFTCIILYFGTCFVQFLSWSPIGQFDMSVSPRYILPFFVLLPFIFGLNFLKEIKTKFDYYIITLTISFMALMVMSFIFGFY